MRISKNFLFIFCLMMPFFVNAQDSYKKLAKMGEQLLKDGKLIEAGENYLKAWKLKPKKSEYAYMAGHAFYLAKDYNKAAAALEPVKDMNGNFEKVGYEYARALKQSGRYEDAEKEFVYFQNAYKGKDFEKMNQLVQNEILGCQLAVQTPLKSSGDWDFKHLGANVNSDAMEYAPVPFVDGVIYYSSTVSGTSKIYMSQRMGGAWQEGKVSETIEKLVSKTHFGNGCLTADNKRFYFTQCEDLDKLNVRCDIYVMESKGKEWSDPVKLPEYINAPNASNTHPYVFVDGKIEYLYFASNREDGKGGMDIWYSKRDAASTSYDYTFPQNLGSKINTPGDELSPHYDVKKRILYYSSDGAIGYGGLDVFRAEGKEFNWSKVKNMGFPFNSRADDWHFVLQGVDDNGFLVSNRLWDLDKLTTNHTDIFSFRKKTGKWKIALSVKDGSGKGVDGAKVNLYEKSEMGQKRLITSQKIIEGSIELPLMPSRKYLAEIEKSGYKTSSVNFNTDGKVPNTIFETVNLGGAGVASTPVLPPKPITEPTKPVVEPPVTEPSKPVVTHTPSEPSKPVTEPSKPVVTHTPSEPSKPITEPSSKPMVPSHSTSEPSKPVVSEPVVTHTPSSPSKPPVTWPTKPEVTTHTPSEPSKPVSSGTVVSSHRDPVHSSNGSVSEYPKFNSDSRPVDHSSTSSGGGYTSTPANTGSNVQSGYYFKVQLEAVANFRTSKYDSYSDLGMVESEFVDGKNLYRALLGNYDTKDQALIIMEEVRSRGKYVRAYMVLYKDGMRVGRRNP